MKKRRTRDGDCHSPLKTSLAGSSPVRLREMSFVEGTAESRKVGAEIMETDGLFCLLNGTLHSRPDYLKIKVIFSVFYL